MANNDYNPIARFKHLYDKGKIIDQDIDHNIESWNKETANFHEYYRIKFKGDESWEFALSAEGRARSKRRKYKHDLDFILAYKNELLAFETFTRKKLDAIFYDKSARWKHKQVNHRIDLYYGHCPKWIHKSELTIRRNLPEIYAEIQQAFETLKIRKDAYRQEPIYPNHNKKRKIKRKTKEKLGTGDSIKAQKFKLDNPKFWFKGTNRELDFNPQEPINDLVTLWEIHDNYQGGFSE